MQNEIYTHARWIHIKWDLTHVRCILYNSSRKGSIFFKFSMVNVTSHGLNLIEHKIIFCISNNRKFKNILGKKLALIKPIMISIGRSDFTKITYYFVHVLKFVWMFYACSTACLWGIRLNVWQH